MKKELSTGFDARQYMKSEDFEIFYYKDTSLSHVEPHAHDYYEFYFFLEGQAEYLLGNQLHHLEPGDYLLIPPGILHNAEKVSSSLPYRRFVLWFSRPFFHSLCQEDSEGFGYAFRLAQERKGLHLKTDSITAQETLGLLMEIMEEKQGARPFRSITLRLGICSFLVYLNRLTYDLEHPVSASYESALYASLCDYINQHLEEDLSLDRLASFFFISKYHISHVFKDRMGISLHQYILKKRLHACKNAILSGMAFAKICQQYGFHDYTAFYRAFKKEYGISPKEYREQHAMVQPDLPQQP